MTGVYTALAALPALLLLYFLKLKRQEKFVSSTLIWKRAVQDLQVNAPFQRLRRNLLLLLQLIALVAALLALAGPILALRSGPAQRYVLLIDRSASMSSRDVVPSRLDQARDQAHRFVDALREASLFSFTQQADQAMIVAFDNHAKLMCNFTADKNQLHGALAAITATDAGSSLAEAVTVARAFLLAGPAEGDNVVRQAPPQLELFSDGRIHDLDQVTLSPGELNFHCVGQTGQNLAIVAMQARRSFDQANEVAVFATLANFSDEAVDCEVQLSLNGDIRAVRAVQAPPRKVAQQTNLPDEPGMVSLSFSLTFAHAGVIEVRQLLSDPLPADDAAWAVLAPPKELAVLLVTEGNAALEAALRACPLARLDTISPAQFAQQYASATDFNTDVTVLDNCNLEHLPRGRHIVFGKPPTDLGVQLLGTLDKQLILDWRNRHPILQYVNLNNIFASEAYQLQLPRDAEVLAEFNDAPALALLRRQGGVFLLAPFDPLQTNWPFEPGFVMFFYNAVQFLGLEMAQGELNNLQVGDPIILEGQLPQTKARLEGPARTAATLVSDGAGAFRFAATDRAGLYWLNQSDEQNEPFAVNLLSRAESDIAPQKDLDFATLEVQAAQGPIQNANLEVWPYLVALVLIIAVIEWLVYTSRIRL